MKPEDFDYKLPNELIAQRPASPRDNARLLVYDRASQIITDDVFYNIAKYLDPQTTLVLNNTKVEKARLNFSGVEVFLLETHNDTTVTALVRPGKKFKMKSHIQLTPEISCTVIDINDEGHRVLEFSLPLDAKRFDPYRLTPLPPYIAQDESLADEYQTIYAKDLGSKAAPTAGLHFTDDLLQDIKKTWPVAELTLHVGLGTFAPLTEKNLKEKRLHEETIELDSKNAMILNQATHITAVGTTSVRSLESLLDHEGRFHPTKTKTDIFIQPGDTLRATQSIITNFHLPKSSLMMLLAAFTGRDELLRIYKHAVEHNYRFYSFGDAMMVR